MVVHGSLLISEVDVLQELKKHNVKDVVRVCEPTYNTNRLNQEGITVTVSVS